MAHVTLDAELRAKLKNLTLPLALCDEAGNVVAWVTPAKNAEPPPMSKEELDRRLSEPDYFTAEVLDHLRRL